MYIVVKMKKTTTLKSEVSVCKYVRENKSNPLNVKSLHLLQTTTFKVAETTLKTGERLFSLVHFVPEGRKVTRLDCC